MPVKSATDRFEAPSPQMAFTPLLLLGEHTLASTSLPLPFSQGALHTPGSPPGTLAEVQGGLGRHIHLPTTLSESTRLLCTQIVISLLSPRVATTVCVLFTFSPERLQAA